MGRACSVTVSQLVLNSKLLCDLTLGFVRCQCVAFGNNFTTSFAEEYKDRDAVPRGLSESMTVWFMGGGNKITLTLSGAEVPQVSRARVSYFNSHSTVCAQVCSGPKTSAD